MNAHCFLEKISLVQEKLHNESTICYILQLYTIICQGKKVGEIDKMDKASFPRSELSTHWHGRMNTSVDVVMDIQPL